MPQQNVLICTVGGSYQPIITAIRNNQSDYVCFICTGKDSATGRPGSDTQITGKGNIIKAKFGDPKPTLPNIPTQAGLNEEQYEVVNVPADDLDVAYTNIHEAVKKLTERFPNASMLADYTGGTKTMTAALVIVALGTEQMDLQLVTGSRADLVKVRQNTEQATPVNVERIRLERAVSPYIAAWQRYAYDEAAIGLKNIRPPRNDELRRNLWRLCDLSKAFAAWDRFAHAQAFEKIDIYRPKLGKSLSKHFTTLEILTDENRREPMQILDLWRNAERRASQGRYDDAVARIYRLIEWTAQWLLRSQCEINTSEIPPEKVPADVKLPLCKDGQHYQAGLFDAWKLVGSLTQGAAAQFIQTHEKRLQNHIHKRNASILAHGFTSITKADWDEWANWMATDFLPMFEEEAIKIDKRFFIPPQLPTDLTLFDEQK